VIWQRTASAFFRSVARGIDTAAHARAIQVKGRTIAVMEQESTSYRKKNAKLVDEILNSCGAVVSSVSARHAADTGKLSYYRNRIITG
jgi:predicted Rossmann fold nucleotide-binding protein DprA/Smf involved in DNA uptake